MSAEEPAAEVAIRPNKVIYSDLSKEQNTAAVTCVNMNLENVSITRSSKRGQTAPQHCSYFVMSPGALILFRPCVT